MGEIVTKILHENVKNLYTTLALCYNNYPQLENKILN